MKLESLNESLFHNRLSEEGYVAPEKKKTSSPTQSETLPATTIQTLNLKELSKKNKY